jgi:hypothetical protein
MFQVDEDPGMGVVEDGSGFFKPDAGLTPVASIFLLVPLEPKQPRNVRLCRSCRGNHKSGDITHPDGMVDAQACKSIPGMGLALIAIYPWRAVLR